MTADLLKRLIEAGTPATLVAEVAVELARAEAERSALTRRRDSDRGRKARARAAASPELQFDDVESHAAPSGHVTGADDAEMPFPAPAPSFPPDPQTNPTPTHTRVGTPRARGAAARREGDRFPMPDGVDPQHWADFLAARRAKRLPDSRTAHRRLMADLARLADDEWPPGRLIEFAAGMGWGGIYDPRRERGRHEPSRDNPPRQAGGAPGPEPAAEPRDPLVRAALARAAERAAWRPGPSG